ncbi:MAG TPA: polysaccharide biosynthesis C-terminal domain-containing protein [Terriglobia bacterium]|jgi:O-antigen/teichoic acid export membrane protein
MTSLTQMRSGAHILLKPGAAFLDQAILSGTNFVAAFILIKTVAKEEYGYYSIALAASLFLVSIQNAVVTTPLAVLLAGKHDEEKDSYAGSLYWGQMMALVPAAAAGLLSSVALYLYGFHGMKVVMAGCLSFAAAGLLLREFARAYYFAEQSPYTVLLLDSYYAAAFLVLIGVVYRSFRMTAATAFVVMGISALVATALIKNRNWIFSWPAIRESYREHWPLAKWSLAGVLVTHLQSYCTLYLTGTMLGSSAAGSVAASRLPLTPMTLLQTGWNKVAIPRGAHLREAGRLRRFLREQALVAGVVAAGVAAYAALLWMSAGFLKTFLFNRDYEGALDFIGFWAAINVAVFAGLTASAGLQVMKEFGAITKINCATMAVTLVFNVIFIGRYGIKGGLASSLLGESLLAVSLWSCLVRRFLQESRLDANQTGKPRALRLSVAGKEASL